MSPILALIPARGGSKRVARKNLQVVGGRTLLQRAIDCAKAVPLHEVLVGVSTDDPEIFDAARAGGADRVLRRPREMANDDTPMAVVVQHWIEEAGSPEIIVILEPPACFRLPEEVAGAINMLLSHPDATGVRTVTRQSHHLPYHLHRIARPSGYLDPFVPEVYRTWPAPAVYRDNGIANVIRVSAFERNGYSLFDGRILAFETPDDARSIDIDTPEDLALAQVMARDLDRV